MKNVCSFSLNKHKQQQRNNNNNTTVTIIITTNTEKNDIKQTQYTSQKLCCHAYKFVVHVCVCNIPCIAFV